MHFNFDVTIDKNILVDNLRLQQILINCKKIAIKFTAVGDVKLQPRLMNRIDGLQYLRFSVMDYGIKINRHKTHKLLLALEQADWLLTHVGNGRF